MEAQAVRKIIHILIDSRFYFELSLRERHELIKYILKAFPYAL
jgi:hypothetical protein